MNQENNLERSATPMPEAAVSRQGERITPSSTHELEGARAVEIPAAPLAAPPLQATMPVPSMQSGGAIASTTPAVADDVDLIEKEWVEKAKELVARTRIDPYAQSSEMSRMKADYIKKRYNKDVKVSDK